MQTNILVVEDSPSMQALTAGVVESIGYTALLADSGEDAITVFQQNNVDLAILDVNLPGIDGFETCRKLREISQNDWFPVIYLSASDSDDYIVKGLDAGGDAYVKKPVNTKVLISIVSAMGRISNMKKELAEANEKLEKLASHDGLTQIPNRRSFEISLEKYWKQSKRQKVELALLIIDVDYFKKFNDKYGHLSGDDCLKQVAQELAQNLLRPFDFVARYGGEEFVILLPEINLEGTQFVANRLVKAIEKLAIPHEDSETSQHVTISMGVVLSNEVETQQEMITKADQALYQAKANGRNQFVEYSNL